MLLFPSYKKTNITTVVFVSSQSHQKSWLTKKRSKALAYQVTNTQNNNKKIDGKNIDVGFTPLDVGFTPLDVGFTPLVQATIDETKALRAIEGLHSAGGTHDTSMDTDKRPKAPLFQG